MLGGQRCSYTIVGALDKSGIFLRRLGCMTQSVFWLRNAASSKTLLNFDENSV